MEIGEVPSCLSDGAAVPWAVAGLAMVTMSAANAMIEYFISNLTCSQGYL
jgi:hypothetical protein